MKVTYFAFRTEEECRSPSVLMISSGSSMESAEVRDNWDIKDARLLKFLWSDEISRPSKDALEATSGWLL